MSDEAIEAIVDALVDASDDNVDELEEFAEYVLDGLRAAGFELYRLDDMTEGDGIWWCERHQCRWGYTPDCGWSPRGEACPKSRRLLIKWEADGAHPTA